MKIQHAAETHQIQTEALPAATILVTSNSHSVWTKQEMTTVSQSQAGTNQIKQIKTLILCKTFDLIAGVRNAVKWYSADWTALEVSVNTRSHGSSQSSGPELVVLNPFCVSETVVVFANGKSQVAMSSRRSGALRRSLFFISCSNALATKTIKSRIVK